VPLELGQRWFGLITLGISLHRLYHLNPMISSLSSGA
jgi:hypothetical protein